MHTDFRLPIGPLAEVDVRRPRALTAILRKPVGIEGGILVVESPRSDNLQSGGLRSLQTEFDICGVLWVLTLAGGTLITWPARKQTLMNGR